MRRGPAVVKIVVVLAGLGVACHKPTNPSAGTSVADFVAGIDSVAGAPTTATAESGSAPAPSGGPLGAASGDTTAVLGGSSEMLMTAGSPFVGVDVSVGNASGPTPLMSGQSIGITQLDSIADVSGFWKLTLPAAVTSQSLIVKFAKNIPFQLFELRFQLVAAGGAVGPVASIRMTSRATTTGTVSITATWDAVSNLNLHVVEPGGFEIWSQAPTSPSGGALNRDAIGPNCLTETAPSETVSWANTTPPVGDYIVRLDQFNSCQSNITNYIVIINNGGSVTQFSGVFTPPGDAGGAGSGRLIKAFTHQATGSTIPFSLRLAHVFSLTTPAQGGASR